MSNDKIIIVSNGHSTHIMVNGKLYDHVSKVEFTHDHTKGKRDEAELLVTVDHLPAEVVRSAETKQGFMKLVEEFARDESSISGGIRNSVERALAESQTVETAPVFIKGE